MAGSSPGQYGEEPPCPRIPAAGTRMDTARALARAIFGLHKRSSSLRASCAATPTRRLSGPGTVISTMLSEHCVNKLWGTCQATYAAKTSEYIGTDAP